MFVSLLGINNLTALCWVLALGFPSYTSINLLLIVSLTKVIKMQLSCAFLLSIQIAIFLYAICGFTWYKEFIRTVLGTYPWISQLYTSINLLLVAVIVKHLKVMMCTFLFN